MFGEKGPDTNVEGLLMSAVFHEAWNIVNYLFPLVNPLVTCKNDLSPYISLTTPGPVPDAGASFICY